MNDLPKSVRKVVIIEAEGQAILIYNRKRRRKRQSGLLRPIEVGVRRALEGARAGANKYLAGHDDSNRKRRDGWLQDVGKNVFKASRKATSKTMRGAKR